MSAVLPLKERIKTLVNLQFLWFVGHLVTVVHSFYWFYGDERYSYYKALCGSVLRFKFLTQLFNYFIQDLWTTSV